MNFPDPDQTLRNCAFGCGSLTVLARLGDGRQVRVHCGTWRTTCPGRSSQTPPAPAPAVAHVRSERVALLDAA
ncbi:hypothetical protein KIPE111705_36890 [Kibdelosporangium persicum]|uniref:hypothetical protein n=1 Tax=Kibdelosporangium persicum TaxID=2698649 RepID=UPI001567A68F|nr:hypothetical protein [Kibdelosporangium persicum]